MVSSESTRVSGINEPNDRVLLGRTSIFVKHVPVLSTKVLICLLTPPILWYFLVPCTVCEGDERWARDQRRAH